MSTSIKHSAESGHSGHGLSTSREFSMNAKFVLRMTAPMIGVSMLLLAIGVVSAWYVHRLQKEN
ncbi:MAG TPA: hypothetical protein PK867_04555 [Pirellulales bacterium]|nr:hypothetical protein [Pirellulales bacterium]